MSTSASTVDEGNWPPPMAAVGSALEEMENEYKLIRFIHKPKVTVEEEAINQEVFRIYILAYSMQTVYTEW